ncbi:MAG: hypothetical protein J1F23_08300 [Oscillospiraceae bacterium]|nr:hypothetical protein [Oscillospiraceae bacterium]
MENRELIKTILRIEFPKEDFSNTEIEFLERFKIGNETESSILKSKNFLGENFTKVEDFYKENEHIRQAKRRLQELRNIFNRLYRGNKDRVDPPFDGDFTEFLKWWYYNEDLDERGVPHCHYCGIGEDISKKAFTSLQLFTPKKQAWKNGSIQIDKMNPHPADNDDKKDKDLTKGYNAENCVFACILCNNAKSDLIGADDFKKIFGPKIKEYWDYIVKEKQK